MKFVTLKKHYKQYNPGEIASFDDAIAKDLIAAGVADEVTSETSSKPAKEEQKSK